MAFVKSSDVGGLAISSVSAVNRINAATVIESAAHEFHSINNFRMDTREFAN